MKFEQCIVKNLFGSDLEVIWNLSRIERKKSNSHEGVQFKKKDPKNKTKP
jgi:hypothetical protein